MLQSKCLPAKGLHHWVCWQQPGHLCAQPPALTVDYSYNYVFASSRKRSIGQRICLSDSQRFDCRSLGKSLTGKIWVSASALACNSAAPLPFGNWHMSGIRHTGNQATSLQITQKKWTNCLLSNWLRHLGHSGWIILIIFIQVLKWIYFGRLLSLHIYLPWTFEWSSFTNTDVTLTESFCPSVLPFPCSLLPVSTVHSKGKDCISLGVRGLSH